MNQKSKPRDLHGQLLYDLWRAKQLELANCGTDSWDQLDKMDQIVWEAMADHIKLNYNIVHGEFQL